MFHSKWALLVKGGWPACIVRRPIRTLGALRTTTSGRKQPLWSLYLLSKGPDFHSLLTPCSALPLAQDHAGLVQNCGAGNFGTSVLHDAMGWHGIKDKSAHLDHVVQPVGTAGQPQPPCACPRGPCPGPPASTLGGHCQQPVLRGSQRLDTLLNPCNGEDSTEGRLAFRVRSAQVGNSCQASFAFLPHLACNGLRCTELPAPGRSHKKVRDSTLVTQGGPPSVAHSSNEA